MMTDKELTQAIATFIVNDGARHQKAIAEGDALRQQIADIAAPERLDAVLAFVEIIAPGYRERNLRTPIGDTKKQ